MIQTPVKSYEEIRTVLSNETNEVLVCRSMTRDDSGFYTVVRLKDRALHTRLLKVFSGNFSGFSMNDFFELTTVDSQLALIFPYNKENRLFYYQPLYCRHFSDRLNIAKNLLAELISTPLPVEILFFLLEEYNLNLRRDGRVYFNFFLDFQLLPDELDMQYIINKAAEILLRILTNSKNSISHEAELFRVKVQRKSFASFGAIYADLKRISPDAEINTSLPDKIKRTYSNKKKYILSAVKTGILVLLIGASVLYSISELRSRSAVSALSSSEVKPAYKGLEKIGSVNLPEDTDKQEIIDETD
jgi:hypothetical protein